MRTTEAVAFQREDYTAPAYQIPITQLTVRLHPHVTLVSSRLSVVRQPDIDSSVPLVLDGVGLNLRSVSVNGEPLAFESLVMTDKHLTLSNCLLYTSPSPRDATLSRMPSSA